MAQGDLVLTPMFLVSITGHPGIQKKWPFFKDLNNKIINRSSSCCGKDDKIKDEYTERIKQFILAMPKPDLDELKHILKVPLTTKFTTFNTVERRIRKVEL